MSDSCCCVINNYLRNWHPSAYWQLHLLKSSYMAVSQKQRRTCGRLLSHHPGFADWLCAHDQDGLRRLEGAQGAGAQQQQRRGHFAGRHQRRGEARSFAPAKEVFTGGPHLPDAERCHARRLTSVAPHPCGPARAARPSRALPAPSLLIASLPAPSGTKRCRVGRPVSGAWA